MSLINDALKRANETHQRQGASRSAEPPLQPAARTAGARERLMRVVGLGVLPLGIVVLGCMALSGDGQTKVLNPKKPEASAARHVSIPRRDVLKPQVPRTPNPQKAPASPNRPADLRLEAVHYRLRNPSVIINGRTLSIGDEIAGARVVGIGRKSVRLFRQGGTDELQLR